MVRTRCYREGRLVREGFAVDEVSTLLADPANTVWLDICHAEAADLEAISQDLGLHDLAVEDVLDRGQRPKVDHYPEHLFVVAYAIDFDTATAQVREHEIAIFVTSQAVVTVREDEAVDIETALNRWDDRVEPAPSGVQFVLHAILDYIVDTHFDAVQQLDVEVESLEDDVFNEATGDTVLQRRNFEVRKSLVAVRRLVLPMREVVNTLLRRDLRIVDERMAPYFQDVYDHVLRAAEWTDSLRDLLANILETRLTVRANRLNTITKKVTGWAAIIAVPTAVTGFYGQNIPYPGFGQLSGLWTSIAIMLALSIGLYIAFKVNDWL